MFKLFYDYNNMNNDTFIFVIIILILCSCCSSLSYHSMKYIIPVLMPTTIILDPKNTNAEIMKPTPDNSLIREMDHKYRNNFIYSFPDIFNLQDQNTSDNLISQLYDKLTIMSSSYKATIIIDKNIILNETKDRLYFVILTIINNKLKVRQSREFNINCDRSDMINMINFIGTIDNSDTIIIVSKGNALDILSNTSDNIVQKVIFALQKIGAKTNIFRKSDNYLLITSKSNSTYYELSSPEPIYFPSIDINFEDCRTNPGNVLYPEKYILFDDKTYDNDKINKCAMEALMRQYNKFGIIDNYCLPMSDNDYMYYKQMNKSNKCIFGEGKNVANAVSGYIINKSTKLKQSGITFFEKTDQQGYQFVLNEGEYDASAFNKRDINSIDIPDNYFLFMISDNIMPFYGPLKTNLSIIHKKFFNDFNYIVVQKHLKDDAIICGENNHKQICMTFSRGTHILHHKLFINILYVRLGNSSKVALFSDIDRQDLIGEFYSHALIKIKFPRITRSIIVS